MNPHWLIASCSDAFLIILGDHKAKVADNEAYIAELMEEKTQAEEQYLKEKQIITG